MDTHYDLSHLRKPIVQLRTYTYDFRKATQRSASQVCLWVRGLIYLSLCTVDNSFHHSVLISEFPIDVSEIHSRCQNFLGWTKNNFSPAEPFPKSFCILKFERNISIVTTALVLVLMNESLI